MEPCFYLLTFQIETKIHLLFWLPHDFMPRWRLLLFVEDKVNIMFLSVR